MENNSIIVLEQVRNDLAILKQINKKSNEYIQQAKAPNTKKRIKITSNILWNGVIRLYYRKLETAFFVLK